METVGGFYGRCRTQYRRGNSGAGHRRWLRIQQQPPKTLGPITETASQWYPIHQNANFMTAKTVLRFFLTGTWR